MELIIDKNGKAVDLADVSVTIIYESKEEADRMKEAMADGRVQQLEWHPIQVRIGEEMPGDGDMQIDGDTPEDGQVVFISVTYASGKRGVTTDVFCRDQEFCYFEDWDLSQVEAWAPMPKPYEKRED